MKKPLSRGFFICGKRLCYTLLVQFKTENVESIEKTPYTDWFKKEEESFLESFTIEMLRLGEETLRSVSRERLMGILESHIRDKGFFVASSNQKDDFKKNSFDHISSFKEKLAINIESFLEAVIDMIYRGEPLAKIK